MVGAGEGERKGKGDCCDRIVSGRGDVIEGKEEGCRDGMGLLMEGEI